MSLSATSALAFSPRTAAPIQHNNLTLGAQHTTGNGTYNLIKGNLNVTGNEIIGNNGTGTFTQIGGTHTANFLYVGNGTGSTGTFNLQGGTLSVTHFILMRDGTFNVKNTTTTVTTGLVDNRKVVTTTNANVTWNSAVVSTGAYISQNSTQTFNSYLQVAYSGYLVGGSQDVFIVKDDFLNQSTANRPMEHGPVHPEIRHGRGQQS